MLYSEKFQQATITFNDKQYKIEYDVANAIPGSVRAFGNVYVEPDEPMGFTFFTINNKIAGYTPMNGTKEFIESIVEAVLGQKLPFEN